MVKRLLRSIAKRLGLCLPTVEDEKAFLQYQIDLRKSGTGLLEEAMDVLDIIDAKSEALLAYISLSFAAMVFLLTGLQDNPYLEFEIFGQTIVTGILLIIILALLVAIIFCISCLNIVGAHTIRALKSSKEQMRRKEYEELIIRVTLGRRIRYLTAHRISTATAVGLIALFVGLLLCFLG